MDAILFVTQRRYDPKLMMDTVHLCLLDPELTPELVEFLSMQVINVFNMEHFQLLVVAPILWFLTSQHRVVSDWLARLDHQCNGSKSKSPNEQTKPQYYGFSGC